MLPRPLFGYFILVDGDLYEHWLKGGLVDLPCCPMFDTKADAEEFIEYSDDITGETEVVNTSAVRCG